MNRVSVTSSNIKSVGWENESMEVEFMNGAVYQYDGVPADVHQNLIEADSVGSFFHTEIKGNYAYRRVA